MAFIKDNLYWKVTSVKINRTMRVAYIEVQSYENKEVSDKNNMFKSIERVNLSGSLFPFIEGLETEQIAKLYENIKIKSDYFNDALDA